MRRTTTRTSCRPAFRAPSRSTTARSSRSIATAGRCTCSRSPTASHRSPRTCASTSSTPAPSTGSSAPAPRARCARWRTWSPGRRTSPAKKIVEAPTEKPVPTAGETLARSVIYFILPNPDGWARGQVAPAELEDGSAEPGSTRRARSSSATTATAWTSTATGRGWATSTSRTRRAPSPRRRRSWRCCANIRVDDLAEQSGRPALRRRHRPARPARRDAFSFTLLGAGQRDYRKNFSTVDQGLRTWEDQTARLAWSPYIGTVFGVADQWGTVIDTLGYQVTGALGDWIENEEIGLGAVGIDNEMSLSHLAPNNVFDPTTEQMHVDGNKGLIYSQLASMLTEQPFVYEPSGQDRVRRQPGSDRARRRESPAEPGLAGAERHRRRCCRPRPIPASSWTARPTRTNSPSRVPTSASGTVASPRR